MSRELVDSGINWLGNIPKSWDVIKVKNVFKSHKDIAGSESKNFDRISLTLNGVIRRDKEDVNGLQPENFDTYQIVNQGDIIFKLIDLENVNTSRVGRSDYTGITSPVYILLHEKNETSKYYDYYFDNLYYQEVFNNIGGNGVRSAINKDDLLNIPLLSVPIEEQNKISNFLDIKCNKIRKIIEDNNKEIELLEECKNSYISELIMTNNSNQLKSFNKEWITNIDDSCVIKKLKYVAKLQTGTTPSGFEESNEEEKIDWFTPSDFNKLNLSSSSRKLSKSLIDEKKVYPKNSTLIIGIGGTLGKIGYLDIEAYSNQQITAVIPNKDMYPKYLTYNLIGAMKYIKDTCPYTTMPILSNSYLSNILICYRSYNEQVKIADQIDKYIANIDLVIDYRKKIIKKLEEYKKSLIFECVTGKKEVN
jgi:type I restriction enzyme S subunit